MKDEKEQLQPIAPNPGANPGHGPDGVDKAPGEETSRDTDNFVADTQKAKQPVDADPEGE